MDKISPARARSLEVIAAFGLGVEALALGLAALAYGMYAAFGRAPDVGFIAAVGAFCLLLAAAVAAASWGMWRSRRWSRSLAVTWQVFQLGLGLAVMATRPVVGIILIALAVVVGGCVMVKAGSQDSEPEGSDVVDAAE
jgi:hypothetical protein